jgi:hypothetical protein
MIQEIVTHPGGAHKDDVLAVCILVAMHGAPVVRRNPTDNELDDPHIAVLDIGGSDDSSKSNFDHHQYPREHEPTCSLSLVLQHLGLYEDARIFFDWLEPAEWFDSRGPNRTAEWLGVSRRVISQVTSPIDVTLLRRFAQETELASGGTLYEYMRLVGQDLLDYLRVARERIDFARTHSARWSIPKGDDMIEVVFLPQTDPPADEPSTAVGNYIRAEGLDQTIAAIVYPDRRGGGYGIGRYEDHPKLDFSRVEDEADVHFAHQERLHVQDVGNRAGTTAGVSRGCVESGLSSLSRRSTIATVSPRSVRRSADLRATDSSVGRCGFAPATRTARARAPAAQGAGPIPVSLVDPKCRSAEFLDSTASGRLRAPDCSSQCDNARPTP